MKNKIAMNFNIHIAVQQTNQRAIFEIIKLCKIQVNTPWQEGKHLTSFT